MEPGGFLLRKLKDVINNLSKQQAQFSELLQTYSGGSTKISEWDTAILLWEDDKSKPDPYDESEYGERQI